MRVGIWPNEIIDSHAHEWVSPAGNLVKADQGQSLHVMKCTPPHLQPAELADPQKSILSVEQLCLASC